MGAPDSTESQRRSTTIRTPTPVARRRLPLETLALARWLIGRILVREVGRTVMTGRIVETEGYLPDDAASHSFRGETKRNRSMYLRRGHAYVYFIYGTSFMLNISSGEPGFGAAVLIRALEPLSGIEQMRRNRRTTALRALTRGPGRLAQAMQIDFSLDGVDLCRRGPLWLADDGAAAPSIAVSRRIGISRNVEPLWRFSLADSPFVSRGATA